MQVVHRLDTALPQPAMEQQTDKNMSVLITLVIDNNKIFFLLIFIDVELIECRNK